MTTGSSSENTYILGHTEAEMVRLIEQGRLFTTLMGGLFPEGLEPSRFHAILDVGCGPGGWALDVAHAHPHIQVTGLDIDSGMINYANALAQTSRLDNSTFTVMNALEPLRFPDASFDLVNGQFMGGFVPTALWPKVMQELTRITRRGGVIMLTDAAWDAETSSPAYNAVLTHLIAAMQRASLSFSPDGRHYSITMMLGHFLRAAGCTDIQEKPHVINFSSGTSAHSAYYDITQVAFEQMKPFLLAMGVLSQQQFEQIHRDVLIEMLEDNFRGILYMLTAWGRVP